MRDKRDLIDNIDKVHTTSLGIIRIKNNLNIVLEPVCYCKQKILNEKSKVYKNGKNYYCEIDDIIITINSYSYTIITAHKKGKR